MKNMKKRVWALVLAFVLVVGLLPTNTFATEVDGDVNVTSVAETVDSEVSTAETVDNVMAIDEEPVDAVTEGEWNGSSISNVAELIAFRDAVNSGVDFAGKTVELLADIDMSGIDWSVNIGDDFNYSFDGTFDGNGHTIKNLSSTETAQKADGYVCTGLFGAIGGSAVIKDLTLTNVSISAGAYTGNNVSALVGFAYNATGTISNVKVTGSIDGADISGVGAIVGYVYGGSLTVENCTAEVDVNGAAYVGGIVGYGGKTTVANCTVNNSTITAKACVAGVMGLSSNGAVATGNTVNSTNITATHDNWKNSAAVVVGTMAGKNVTVSGTSYTDVTLNGAAGNAIVGSEYKEHPTTPVAKIEASVGDVYYFTLQEAIDAAKAGDTVKLDADIITDGTFYIAADDVITLDLNGKTISGTDNTEKGNSALININKGSLTVTGNGTLTLTATVDRDINAASAVISNNQGTVTIVNGTIKHLGGTYMAYAIDNLTNGGIGDVTLNIKGGLITSTYRAIRQFANSATKVNNLFVTGGEITSTSGNYGVWVQSSNASANKAVLSITGGSVSSVYVYAPSDASEVKVKIADGCVAAIKEAVTEGRDIQVKVNGVNCNLTLQEVINEAAKGETIALVKDIVLAESLTIAADDEIVLDLNGKTISGVDNATNNFGLINVSKGNLTVKDSVGTGKITLEATNNRGWDAYSAAIANNQGVVTVESGTIEHTGGTDMAYAIDNLTNGGIGDATLNVTGGVITSTYRAIRQFANSATKVNNLFITGGTITSTTGNKGAVWVQSSNAKANKALLSITGGSVSSVYVNVPVDNKGVYGDASGIKVKISESCVGTIAETLPAGYTISAKLNNVNYNSLEDAIKEAANGGEVTLLTDIALTDRLTIKNDAVINLNGKTITSPECVFVVESGTLTIKGEGNVKANTDNDDGMAIAVWARGGHAVIYGGSYYFGSDNVHDAYDHQTEGIYTSGGGTIKIYGGEYFSGKGVWTLNEHDSNRGTLTVYGGKFHNFNPSNNVSEGPNTNFVADGYWAREYEGGYWMVAEKGEIKVETEKTENSVSATLTEEDVKAAIEGDYTIDVTVVDEEVTSVAIEVESRALTTLAENNKAVVLETNVGTINFNSEAVNRLANAAEGNALEISISDEKSDELNRGAIITLEAKVGENNAFVEGAGTATITVKTTLTNGYVYYMVSKDRLVEMKNVKFEDGTVTWETNHFSDYLISETNLIPKAPVNSGVTGSDSSSDSGSDSSSDSGSDSGSVETPVASNTPVTSVATNEAVVEENDVEIEEEEVPLVSGEEENDEEPVTEESTVDIEEEDTPLASGESTPMNFLWIIVIALALTAGVVATILLKRKEA